jgi:hypothetical protein
MHMKTILAKAGHKLNNPKVVQAVVVVGGLVSMILASGAGGKFH